MHLKSRKCICKSRCCRFSCKRCAVPTVEDLRAVGAAESEHNGAAATQLTPQRLLVPQERQLILLWRLPVFLPLVCNDTLVGHRAQPGSSTAVPHGLDASPSWPGH